MRGKKILSIFIVVVLLTVWPASVFALQRSDVLMLGDKDQWVYELQQELYEQGWLDVSATGYYGTKTQKAVLEFQTENGLLPDGKAGPETRKALLAEQYRAIPPGTRQGFEQVQIENKDIYRPGDMGEEVANIQSRLDELGYYQYGRITGYYGPITEQAIVRFQAAHDLEQDGIAGCKTLEKLYSDFASVYRLTLGDKGDDVWNLQKKLKKYGYYTQEITGYYGSITKSAVEKFQMIHGLSIDGKAGKETWERLNAGDVSIYRQAGSTMGAAAKPVKKEGEELAELAQKKQGCPYLWGGSGPYGFDSAGLISYCLKNMGIATPQTLGNMCEVEQWEEIGRNGLERGDLVFFTRKGSGQVYQAGVYLGNEQFIHASVSQHSVVISDMQEKKWEETFCCGRRVG